MLDLTQTSFIQELFEHQVKQTPDAIAVLYQDQQLTYRELNQKSNQLATYLRAQGVKDNVLVGVYMERSLHMIVTLMAILKAGGAYVPLDLSYPTERLSYMLNHSQASILITHTPLKQALASDDLNVICLDDIAITLVQENAENLSPVNTQESLAYVIYTSGSTGQPKGVAMSHAALYNLLDWQIKELKGEPGSRTLQFTPISFDVSFQEIFGTLSIGGTLVLISEEIRRNPIELLHLLQSSKIERLFLPYVALRQLAEVGAKESDIPENLKEVITAGEQLRITPAMVNWFNRMPSCRLHNHYGPSETHVVTAYTLSGSASDWPELPPIGYPISNTQIYLLNDRMQPVSEGVTGELYIGGTCLANGYLNRPDLTAERFIANPFNTKTESRLYKTGDLAKYLPDNSIEYFGRVDQQVKIRGFRIEPGEIEGVLETHSQVKEAVVLAREYAPGDKRLVAYIVPGTMKSANDQAFVGQLRHYLRSQVPDYMLPSALVVLEAFPLTPSGKVDRRALPIPQWNQMQDGSHVKPRTALETQLTEILGQVLGLEQDKIGIYDRFCDLGGHSLLVVQLIYQINEVYQIKFPLERFLEQPNIAGLAKVIESIQQLESASSSSLCFESEAMLDPSILPENILPEPIPEIFLTGATGFLGTYLLYELLNQTRADVYCLVRASSLAEGQARIQGCLSRYSLWQDKFRSRIKLVLGDLKEPSLGIDADKFSRLAEKIDVIYHCGAWVNMVYPYSALKSSNVTGTQEVLRLASQTRIKPVHFISTVDVFSPANGGNIKTIREHDEIGPSTLLDGGYAQSKCIAEQLVLEASERGLPISLYRFSNLIGDTKLGVSQANSFVFQIIKGCIQMGVIPQLDVVLNLVPVDYVAQSIVHLSQSCAPEGQAFHIANSEPMHWEQLTQWLQMQGYLLQQVSYEAWYAELLKVVNQQTENILASMAMLFSNQPFIQKSLGVFYFECDETISELSQNNIECPALDHDFLKYYFSKFIHAGFLPGAPLIQQPQSELVSARQ